jgi:8-amino-7-oxononanoate synthase
MTDSGFDDLLTEALDRRRRDNQFRQRIPVTPIDSTHVRIGHRTYVNFASNNYLGLTHHPRIRQAIEQSLTLGNGSAAAGLISGYTDAHAAAEQTIARWKQTESAVILPSGYQANIAAVQTLATTSEARKGVRFLLDKLVHASLVDAVRATNAPMRVFPHNNLAKLKRLLEDRDSEQLQVVVTESIFSMDGDAADLSGLATIKEESPFVLLLDEAHGSGVYGANGSGYAVECGHQNTVDISIVTLSKALGCVGGAVCGSKLFCDALLNLGRAYIFSTSVPPMIAAAAKAAIEACHEEPQRQARVRALAKRVRDNLNAAGFSISPGDSPIIPLICGEEQNALDAAEAMRNDGLFVIAVRPPTVPRGSSRLRITLCCDHTDDEIEKLLASVQQLHLRGA